MLDVLEKGVWKVINIAHWVLLNYYTQCVMVLTCFKDKPQTHFFEEMHWHILRQTLQFFIGAIRHAECIQYAFNILLVSTILNSWTHNFQATIIPTFWEFLACGNLVWSLVEFFWADLKLYPTKGCAICLDHSIYHATEWADWTSRIIRPVTYYKTKHWVPKILSNLNCELG